MKKTKEKTPKLKTLELMVISALKQTTQSNEEIHSAYQYMYNHFADEDFLYGHIHKELLKAIYEKDFYKHHDTVRSLEMNFHIDSKTLIALRKCYLLLLCKQLLSIESDSNYSENYYLILLYNTLQDILSDS